MIPDPGIQNPLNSLRPENCTQAKTIPRGYQVMSGEWIALTPNLQLLKSPLKMILSQLDSEEWDPERSCGSTGLRCFHVL